MLWWTSTSGLQLGLLGLAFVLCAFIGLERQFRQKSAGFRTHVLVGTGAAAFTLISAFGFEFDKADAVVPDPSRIAAQIVTGIGFLGAGVIFTRRDVVRGLTTAATIWVSAAVGMACGAGLISLAIGLTAAHLITLLVIGPLFLRLPNRDSNRVLRIAYIDGAGTLRQLLTEAAEIGFSAYIIGTSRNEGSDIVELDVRFRGKAPLDILIPRLHDIQGVRTVYVHRDDTVDDDEA